jgi:2-polyprenyl-3-methyl-5-hydroxy-6-metoxy-1,4-benzoquinol methylase
MSAILNYYEKYNEDGRITSSKARKIEFIVTTYIMDKHIKPQHRILELGAGTGVYSFYYAAKGNEVVATDITPKHVGIIKSKLAEQTDSLNMIVDEVDATDLNRYKSEGFDVVTCFGPMYHLIDGEDRKKCVIESLRVLKQGGYLAIAYVNKNFIPYNILLQDKTFLSKAFIDKILNTGVIKDGEKECFWTDAFFTTPEEMESLIKEFNVEIVDHAGTDGISQLFRSNIDELNEEEYTAWIHYSLSSCRDRSLLGISNHGLLVCRKK